MTAKTRFRGSFTALLTPFKNGSLDEKAFRGLIEWQIADFERRLSEMGVSTPGADPIRGGDGKSTA